MVDEESKGDLSATNFCHSFLLGLILINYCQLSVLRSTIFNRACAGSNKYVAGICFNKQNFNHWCFYSQLSK